MKEPLEITRESAKLMQGLTDAQFALDEYAHMFARSHEKSAGITFENKDCWGQGRAKRLICSDVTFNYFDLVAAGHSPRTLAGSGCPAHFGCPGPPAVQTDVDSIYHLRSLFLCMLLASASAQRGLLFVHSQCLRSGLRVRTLPAMSS